MTLQRTFSRDLQKKASSNNFADLSLSADDGIFVPNPLAEMPLTRNLDLTRGTGVATFTRSTTGTFVDKDDGLIKTAAIDTARFEQNGVLIEGVSENLLLRSEEFDNTSWSKSGGVTISTDSAIAPDGTTTVDTINGLSGTNNSTEQLTGVDPASKTFTASLWLSGSGTITLSMGNAVNQNVEQQFTLNSSLQRLNVTGTFNATAGNLVVRIISRAGDTATSVDAWGIQVEVLPFASSYIPTTTVAVTRGADNLSIDAANIPGPTLDYSISASIDVLGININRQAVLRVAGESTRYLRAVDTGNSDRPRAFHGTGQNGDVLSPKTVNRLTSTVDSTDLKLYQQGVVKGSIAKGAVTGTATSISIGSEDTGSIVNYLYGHIKNLLIFGASLNLAQVKTL